MNEKYEINETKKTIQATTWLLEKQKSDLATKLDMNTDNFQDITFNSH